MKALIPLVLFLLVVVFAAGCTGSQSSATPALTTAGAVSSAAPTATQIPSFTLGEKYLEKKYSFTSESQTYSEGPFRITNDPWGIELTVIPTNEDPQYTWFTITATNIDSGHSETFGYGRTYGFEKHQIIPMYNGGPYKFEMKGNRVSVNVNVAKRNP